MESGTKIRVLTLNCWGIPMVSKDRPARMQALSKHLASSHVDLVCLQEVWSKHDYLFLTDKCKSNLPYCHYYNSGVTGSGLCILSRFPIKEVYFHQWPINGYAHKIHQGDWFGGKGVALARIQITDQLTINLFNTHLHAEYDYECLDYLGHRTLQAFDTSQLIKLTSYGADVAILAGDLNTEPNDIAIKVLTENAGLSDCFMVAEQRAAECSGTNESFRNSYAPSKELQRQPEGKRIDYVLFRAMGNCKVTVKHYLFPLPDRVPNMKFSYSDHEAVEAELEITRQAEETENHNTESKLTTTLKGALEICEDSLRKLTVRKRFYVTSSAVGAILLFLLLFIELFFGFTYNLDSSHIATVVSLNLLKILITCLVVFCLTMATVWCKMEKAAILIGKYSMSVLLNQTSTSAHHFPEE